MSATGLHPEPSAKAPWTRTIVLTAAYAGNDAARAAPVRRARIKRFMLQPRSRSLRRPISDGRLESSASAAVLKLAAEFSPHGTSPGSAGCNAARPYLFQRG